MGMGPTRATCQGYGAQMLLMHNKKPPRSTRQTGETETNGEASDGQNNDRVSFRQSSTAPPLLYTERFFRKDSARKATP